MAETGSLGRMPVALVILLVIVTCGVYIPVWFILTRSTLAGLKTSTKSPRYLPYGLLFLYGVMLCAAVADGVSLFPTEASATHLYSTLSALYFCAHALLAAQLVDILEEYSHEGLTLRRNVAWLRAIIFSVPYLQYEMNRLPKPVDGICPPSKGAEALVRF
jgi:hypothetical protein